MPNPSSLSVYLDAWNIPGGNSPDGKAPEQTLPRRSAEEPGVLPTEYREAPTRSYNAEGVHIHCYCVTEWTGTPRNLQEHEHSEIAWIRLASVDELE